MTALTLAQADRLIDAILARGAELDCRPLSVIVVEPGCKVKAFKKEDGSSMIRFEMAYGKIRDAAGEVIGAVGVTGDTEERDEELAAHGIRAIGLKTDEDCAAMGRRSGIRLTNR